MTRSVLCVKVRGGADTVSVLLEYHTNKSAVTAVLLESYSKYIIGEGDKND